LLKEGNMVIGFVDGMSTFVFVRFGGLCDIQVYFSASKTRETLISVFILSEHVR